MPYLWIIVCAMNANDIPPVLTQQQLETPRSAADMLAWVDAAHSRFSTKQLRAEFREGKHFADELVHEARPMALFAYRYFGASPQVIITHVIGTQNYDAVIDDRREPPETIRYLEATTTLKTYQDSLRMELLSKVGSVAAYGLVTAEGPRHQRISIKAPGIAREHQDIRADHLKLVREVVERKAKKWYEPNTALIVAVDDTVAFSQKADVAALDALATGALVPALRASNFMVLALEGSLGLHMCYLVA
jgi:hypothetical protein